MRLFLWIILPVFMLLVGGKTLVQIQFLADQERIAQEECENRFEERSCCAGKCVLAKRMEVIENAPDDQRNATEVTFPEMEFVTTISTDAAHPCADCKKSDLNMGPRWYATLSPAKEIDHPPKILSLS